MYAADGFRVDTTSHPKPATTRAVHMVAVDNSDGDAADTTAHRTQAIGQGPERLLSWLPSLPQGNRHSSAGSERWLPLPSSRSRAVPQWRIGIDRLSGGGRTNPAVIRHAKVQLRGPRLLDPVLPSALADARSGSNASGDR